MVDATRRPLLPMADHVRGKRSPVTCQLKCANACLGDTCNTSDNGYFRDIVSRKLSRRSALGLGAGLMGAVSLAFLGNPNRAEAAPALAVGAEDDALLPFKAIAPVDRLVDELTVAAGYAWIPIIRWGDPLFHDSPAFDALAQTGASQSKQFGYNNDYTDILRIDDTHALLAVNHEYTNESIMFPADQLANEPARVRAVGRAAHGFSVVELERPRVASPWRVVVGGARNRRFTTDETVFGFTGPAAGSDLLKTVEDPTGTRVRGTLGNCSGGTTPWGTVLTGEENFNGYFRAPGASAEDKRYGLADKATVRGWELDDPRFDARNPGYENEPNRFGWIVEIDPFDPESTPRKHTSLGRFKHEGANIRVDAAGHVAAYTGDDERFDYLYKFVSSRSYVEGDRRGNLRLLERGSLYVARFSGNSPAVEIDGSGRVPADGAFDGTGEWLPLMIDGKSVIDGFDDVEVLVHTRLAADKAGATKMDRCEDVQPSPTTGKVYVACTNNSQRGTAGKAGVDEVNPRNENRDGHIVEITETGDDVTATTFGWNLLLVAGDVKQGDQVYFSGFPAEQVSPISCPDNLAFDSTGALWISTDGAPDGIGYNDGLFKVTLDGPERGLVEQFLSVPRDAETCGPIVHDDEHHVYVSVQHPGEEGAFEAPHSYWPDFAPAGATGGASGFHGPRPAVVQVLPASELVEPTPTPEPTETTTPEPTGSPTGTPTSAPSPSGSTGATPGAGGGNAGGGQGGTGQGKGDGLATTGAEGVEGLIAGAAAVLGAGAVAFLARRSRGLAGEHDEEA